MEKDVFKEEEASSAEGRIPRCSPSTFFGVLGSLLLGNANR